MKPFRRRDAVLGFLAVFPLPLWESHLIDRALREGLGYLNYNKSPLLFVDVTILTLLLAACVCTACDKDDEYEIREWTVASQLGIAHGASTLQPVLLVKANDDTSWRAVYQGIEGFDFEAGYEYRLRIKAEQLPDPPQDGSSIRYTLLEQISKTPATSVIPDQFFPVFTMEVAPQPMNYRGQRFLGVRFPESGLNEWQPWPFRIEGFEYEPGYIYRLRIGTSVIPAPDSPEGYYTVCYSMLDMDRQPAED